MGQRRQQQEQRQQRPYPQLEEGAIVGTSISVVVSSQLKAVSPATGIRAHDKYPDGLALGRTKPIAMLKRRGRCSRSLVISIRASSCPNGRTGLGLANDAGDLLKRGQRN